jgi:hypothetical protein
MSGLTQGLFQDKSLVPLSGGDAAMLRGGLSHLCADVPAEAARYK